MNKLNVFILLPANAEHLITENENQDTFILHDKNSKQLLDQIRKSVDISAREKFTTSFISKSDLNIFLDQLDSGEHYLTNPRAILAEEIYDILKQYSASLLLNQKAIQDRFFIWELYNIKGLHSGSGIAQCANKKLKNGKTTPPNKLVLVNLKGVEHSKPQLTVIKDSPTKNNLPALIKLDIVKDNLELHDWLKTHRTPRCYNSEDNRHGENGRGNRSNKSPLLSSKQHVKDLLPEAIGDATRQRDRLYYYDTTHSAYIIYEYESENPQNQYHAYHLKEKDIDKDIPKNIKYYLSNIAE